MFGSGTWFQGVPFPRPEKAKFFVRTHIPPLFTVGILVFSLAACGGEDPADGAAERSEEGGVGVLDLIAGLGDNTSDVDNYTLDIDMLVSDPELGEIEASITYEVMDDPEAAQVTMVMPAMGEMFLELAQLSGEDPGLTAEELGTSVLIVPAEGEALVSNHNGTHDVDTPWARGVEDTEQFAPQEMFDTDSLPTITEAFSSIEQFEEKGTEEISGVGTTLVEGTMTSEDIDALPPEQKQEFDDLLGGVKGTVDVAIWVTDDGFPMRLDVSDEEADVSMSFSDVNETVFEFPSEDEITDL